MTQTATGLLVPPAGVIGEAFQQSIQIDPPAAGSQLAHMVTGNYFEEVLNFQAFFTTSAAVQTRSLTLAVADNTGALIAILPSAGSQAPSKGYYYNFTPSLPTPFVDTVAQIIGGPVPPLLLLPGWSVQMLVSNIDAGDTFDQIRITVNRIPTGSSAPAPLALLPTPVTL